MTSVGAIHLASMIYLSAAICFAWSLNHQRSPRLVLRETLRRWLKFLGLTGAVMLAVQLLSL